MTRRRSYRHNKLLPDHVKRLEDIGFVWDPLAAAWEEMFGELSAYKQTHGDCNVPGKWKDNPKLGMWCNNQRQRFRKNKFSPDRVKRLEDLGFRIDVRERKKK